VKRSSGRRTASKRKRGKGAAAAAAAADARDEDGADGASARVSFLLFTVIFTRIVLTI
jgi:hypothetical protein